SLVSYLVAERTHEIGLRIALGASATGVLQLVLRYAVKIAIAGLSLGIPTALAASRLLNSLLYGATDPLIFGVASLAIVGISAVACYVPARRAMRLDPIDALRYA